MAIKEKTERTILQDVYFSGAEVELQRLREAVEKYSVKGAMDSLSKSGMAIIEIENATRDFIRNIAVYRAMLLHNVK